MNVLVTGAAGFIGSHLCEELLNNGYSVTGIDNFDPFYSKRIKEKNVFALSKLSRFNFVELDIEDANSINSLKGNFDAVIHLAAKAGVLPSIVNPESYLMTNLKGTQCLLEFIKERSIKKLLFASSSSVYGNNKKVPFQETDNVDFPISPYAYTKKSGELLTYTYHHLYNIDIVNLRFFTVYGPRQRPDLAIHKFFKLVNEGKPITIYGDGSTARDYTFISDTVQGIVSSLEYLFNNKKVYDVFNLGNNSPVRLIDLVNSIYQVTGKEPNIIYESMKPGDVDITYADISKAQSLLNYNPEIGLMQGLEKFYKWFIAA